MNLFAVGAAIIAVLHLVAASQRPRPAVIVSGLLWALYAVYEYLVATGVLCEADCNIRVDLVLFIPVLATVTWCAWQAYNGRPGQTMVIVTVLAAVGLVVFALLAETRFGFAGLAAVGVLAIGLYVIRSRFMTRRS